MLTPNLLLKYFSYLFMLMICFLHTSHGKQSPLCTPSACGHISNISYPFRLRDDPKHCGKSKYQLSCENNTTTILYLGSRKYHVQAIIYEVHTIRLTDPTIKKNDTCSFPQRILPLNLGEKYYSAYVPNIIFMSCPRPVSNSAFFLETTQYCFNQSGNYRRHTYIKFGYFQLSEMPYNCRIDLTTYTPLPVEYETLPFEYKSNVSLSEIHSFLLNGFELGYSVKEYCSINCYCSLPGKITSSICWCEQDMYPIGCDRRPQLFLDVLNWILRILLYGAVWVALRVIIGVPCMLGLVTRKLRRRHLSMFDVIEGFLQSNNNLLPIRYSYSDIKKMTRGFREKLGEGGYGSVYKGKLRSGHDVAIKVLSKSKANGQDFINEVATIGRIHHVNVVKLVGYCAERSKHALVYDFMANGSLDKYIFNRERANSLSWERKYETAIGVARGIEYLHRGCNIQILHFDIKPHNILLDDNFTPKVSDFGLAKFYSTENNTVTLTVARGTIGYVAPELINRSIGGVSYKADVYSFGMLLMDMAGLKDTVATEDDESSKYFPYWIYDRFSKGKDIEIGDADQDNGDDEHARKIRRKITIVGLWCIQMSPSDRPSMGEVLKMLESDGENLQIPPQLPFKSPQTTENNVETWGIESSDSIALLRDDASFDE